MGLRSTAHGGAGFISQDSPFSHDHRTVKGSGIAVGDNKRKRVLFDRYAQSLAACQPEHKELYACPICLDAYTREGLVGPDPALTEEHCVQKGLGPSHYVLTCKDCNSKAGSKVDVHLHHRINHEHDWDDLTKPKDVELIHDDRKIAATVEKGNTGFVFRVQGHRTNPQHVSQLKASVEKKSFSGLTMRFKVFDVNKSHIALLKDAYLLMFRHFGYSYILASPLEVVRQQIRDPGLKLITLKHIVLVFGEHKCSEISRITGPAELDGFCVPIRLKSYKYTFGVIMPVSSNTYTSWDQWCATNSGPPQFQAKAVPFDLDRLVNPDHEWKG